MTDHNSAMVDLVVVGAGLAGLACGARAAELGLSVRVLEQGEGERYPCNSRFAGGMFHLNYLDIAAPVDQIEASLARMCPPDIDADVVLAVGRGAFRCVQWLQDTAGARFVRVGPAPFEKWVLAPPRPPKAGLDHPGRGPDAVLSALARYLAARGQPVMLGTRVIDVIAQAGGGYKIIAHGAAGTLTLRTTAVTFADGGFQGRADLVERHLGSPVGSLVKRNAGTGMGTSAELAARLGAASSDLSNFYGHLLARKALERTDLWPYPMIDGLAKAGILVGPDGRRFADEGLTGVSMANQVARRTDPADALVIFDDPTWWSVGRETRVPPNPVMTNHGGELFSAPSIERLASAIGVDADGLQQTVRAHNDFVDQNGGVTLSPRRSYSNGYARRIAQAPFHAVPVCAGITYTMGGVRVTPGAEVRARDGGIVAGLYAAGAAAGGVEGGAISFYIGGLCKALVLGVLAAESAAAQRLASAVRRNSIDQRSVHDASIT